MEKGTMLKADAKKGMKVLFGRRNGEKTLGVITKVCRKNLKVRQLEERGVKKTHREGTVWTVPPNLCELVDTRGGLRVDDPVTARRASKFDPKEESVDAADKVEKAMIAACTLSNPPKYITSSRRYLDGHSLTKHGAEYDSQRQKLYNAERSVSVGKIFKNLRQAQAFLEEVLDSTWFRSRFGKVEIRMEMTKGWTRSYCRRSSKLIRMLPQHLNERVIIHELTHALVPAPHAGHGRLFCAIYLDIVRQYLGERCYGQLLKGYRREGVKYNMKR